MSKDYVEQTGTYRKKHTKMLPEWIQNIAYMYTWCPTFCQNVFTTLLYVLCVIRRFSPVSSLMSAMSCHLKPLESLLNHCCIIGFFFIIHSHRDKPETDPMSRSNCACVRSTFSTRNQYPIVLWSIYVFWRLVQVCWLSVSISSFFFHVGFPWPGFWHSDVKTVRSQEPEPNLFIFKKQTTQQPRKYCPAVTGNTLTRLCSTVWWNVFPIRKNSNVAFLPLPGYLDLATFVCHLLIANKCLEVGPVKKSIEWL